MLDAVEVFEDLREPVLVTETVEVLVALIEVVAVLLDPIDLDTVGVAVPVLVWETDRVGLGEPVLVLEDVTEPVDVPVPLMVREPLAVFDVDADPVDVFEEPVERVSLGDAVSVFDTGPDLDSVGLEEPVLDDVVVPVLVEVPFPETDPLGDADCVLVTAVVAVPIDVPDPDLDEEDVRVDVIDLVVVLVVVVDGLGSIVDTADLVRVVVFVDVLDIVDVAVSITPPRVEKVGENDASNSNASRSI